MVALKYLLSVCQVVQVVGMAADIGIGGDQESRRASSRILDGFAGLRLN
jgi:hypothetical protein